MDLDSTYMPEREVFSPLFALCLLSLQPSEAWTSIGRRGTWGHISLPPLSSGSSFPPSALSVTVQPRCETESYAQVDPLACAVPLAEPPEAER